MAAEQMVVDNTHEHGHVLQTHLDEIFFNRETWTRESMIEIRLHDYIVDNYIKDMLQHRFKAALPTNDISESIFGILRDCQRASK
eukprot:11316208-Karenia_brevis.AAC.1